MCNARQLLTKKALLVLYHAYIYPYNYDYLLHDVVRDVCPSVRQSVVCGNNLFSR